MLYMCNLPYIAYVLARTYIFISHKNRQSTGRGRRGGAAVAGARAARAEQEQRLGQGHNCCKLIHLPFAAVVLNLLKYLINSTNIAQNIHFINSHTLAHSHTCIHTLAHGQI